MSARLSPVLEAVGWLAIVAGAAWLTPAAGLLALGVMLVVAVNVGKGVA